MAWDDRMKDFRERRERARAMGGAERLARRARRQELLTEWELNTLPYGAAARHLIDEVIDPAHTRDVISRFLTLWDTRGGLGHHRLGIMANQVLDRCQISRSVPGPPGRFRASGGPSRPPIST